MRVGSKFVTALLILISVAVVSSQTIQTLSSFNSTNGANPSVALILNLDGNFYGTTSRGGITNSTYTNGLGTIFRVTTNGDLSTLVFFSFTNGYKPNAITLASDGNIFGTTLRGGVTNSLYTEGIGTVFRITPDGILTTLVFFNGTNGASPIAGLTLGSDDNFYGTTEYGGIVGRLSAAESLWHVEQQLRRAI